MKFIVPYLALYAAVCVLLAGLPRMPEVEQLTLSFVGPLGGLAAISFLLGITIQNVLPREAREILVFWKFNNRLPGYRAFSKYVRRDGRINEQRIANAGGGPALSPEKQNDLWYRWYGDYGSEPSVWGVSRLYLAFRDLAAVALLTSPAALCAWLIGGRINHVGWSLAAFVLGSYLLFVVVARNKAVELVKNVLALRSREGDPEPRILTTH